MSTNAATHTTLMPGTAFPSIMLDVVGGEKQNVSKPAEGKNQLLVFYRGAFCPFCKMSLQAIQEKIKKLEDSSVDVIAISADPLEKAEAFMKDAGINFSVAYGLTEENMRKAGVFVSDPKDYQPQDYRFAEPAYFLLTENGTIRYMDVASNPMGGRPDIDALCMGIGWVKEESERNPAFKDYIWGNK